MVRTHKINILANENTLLINIIHHVSFAVSFAEIKTLTNNANDFALLLYNLVCSFFCLKTSMQTKYMLIISHSIGFSFAKFFTVISNYKTLKYSI